MQSAFQTGISTVAVNKIPLPPIEPDQPTPELIPLSFAQERLWFFSQLERNSALYNTPTAIRLTGELDVAALQKSLNAIIDRHEALRTNFVSDAGTPVQTIRHAAKLEIAVFDLPSRPPKFREDEIQKLIVNESQKPFDLASDLLLRASLIRLDAREHILVLNMHHIVSDEWSLGVLFRELSALYDGSHLPELPIQYADYALWQRECLQGEILQREIRYWKNQLANDFSPLELPTDHRRPSIQTYHGASKSLSLPKNILDSVNDLGRREGVTLFMTLLAAFNALLHRWTGQEQITIGSPISGRNKIETENLIGFFVNTLLLRTAISDEMTFRDLLSRVRETTLGAYAHQELPFEKLVEELHPQRNAGHLSLIQVMFALQNSAENNLKFPGLEVEVLELETQTAKFDLTFVIREMKDGLRLVIEYNTNLFERETIERVLNQYSRLLESIVKNPNEKISRLNLLSEAERQQLLFDWNKTETAYPREKCIHELFATQVETTPDSIVAIFGGQQLTYRDLNERANQLANHLRKSGVGPDVLVAICVERSIEMLVGFLGILKAGGAYVPLDSEYPAERLAFMIEDAQSPVLLTIEKFAARFSGQKSKMLRLDSDWEMISRESKTAPPNQTTSENLAYVIYTSGSTGKPKGVAVPHRAIARLVFNTNYIQLDSSDRIAQASNSSFDAATFEIWGALLHGGKLIGFDKDLILSPNDLAEQLERQKISVIFLTTALFNQIAEDAPHAFRSVKNVLFGGEAVDPKWVKQILAKGPPKRLLHVYGPTESTTFASWFEVREVPTDATTIPIGKPLSNTTFYVLDQTLEITPIGFPGELHIGGDGLARGYFNRPELNATKFISNPFATGKNSLLYKTGDLVRYLPDGNIEFIGRIDHQVKIRGFRIELQEIETILKQHSNVKDALVVVHQENKDKRLVSYFVAAMNPAPSAEELRRFLKEKVPDYMVPSVFVALEKFPLNLNGKIDRHALPAPEVVRADELRSTPLSSLEKKLQEIWENVIGRKPIGVQDNFFDLGGHSLLAVKLFAQIEKQLGKKLPLALLFQSPTVEQLAKAISGDISITADSCLIEIQPDGSRPPIFWLHTLGGGGGGGVLRYQKLAQLLGPDQPSYGLVAPSEPFAQMEAMATHYIQEMRKVQPVGPYHLSGYCFGGVVAFEIAQQLLAAGEEVGLLAVLDSSPANVADGRTLSANARHLFTSLPKRVERFFHQEPSQMLAGLKRKSKQLERMLSALIGHNHAGTHRNEIPLEEVIDMSNYPAGYQRYAEVHWKALLNYFPKVYPGKIVLFETSKSPDNLTVESIWKSLSPGGVEVKRIPSTHEQMLDDPYVRMVADKLRECLDHCYELRKTQIATNAPALEQKLM